MKNKYFSIVLILFSAILFYSLTPADACLNEKLRIGSDNTFEQNAIVEMLSIISGERVGLNPIVNLYNNQNECLKAMKNDEIDVLILYIQDTDNYQSDFNNTKLQYEKDYDFTFFPAYASVNRDGKMFKLVPAVNRRFLRDKLAVPELFSSFTYSKINIFLTDLSKTALNKTNKDEITNEIYTFLTKEKLI